MAADIILIKHSFLFFPAAPSSGEAVWQPPTDIYRTKRGWLVKFDLAGVRPEDFSLIIRGQHLTIRGVRRDFCLEEGCQIHQMEIAYNRFERTIAFPISLEHAEVTVEHRFGMLLVRIQMEAAR